MARLFILLSVSVPALLARQVPADACGLKIASSAPRPRKLTPQSHRPSRVLILGEHPRRTAAVLFEAGHSVEVADRPASVRGQSYHVVVADSERAAEAQQSWPGVILVSSQGSSQDVLARVEAELGRRPVRALVARVPIRTSGERRQTASSSSADERRRVASGGDLRLTRSPIAAGGATSAGAGSDLLPSEGGLVGKGSVPAITGPLATAAIEDRSRPVEPPARVVPRKRVRPGRSFTTTIFFKNGSEELSTLVRGKLVMNARWLARNPDKSVTIYGHTNTVGVPQLNEALSQARAEKVKEFLLEQGVDESRIATKWFGMRRPRFKPGKHPRNRRVVILVHR